MDSLPYFCLRFFCFAIITFELPGAFIIYSPSRSPDPTSQQSLGCLIDREELDPCACTFVVIHCQNTRAQKEETLVLVWLYVFFFPSRRRLHIGEPMVLFQMVF
ncbi:hypothetical protein J3458_001241 [Metarhizium acridum]|uniref:uncharacterized protein n=1 Tax=Metarhizium acridum TaxID=92637 RepID=UPI001C6C8704|nr:hypothetical protein J3458_001241 [Metarhizium acridum]